MLEDFGGFAKIVAAAVVGFPALVGLALIAFGTRSTQRARRLSVEGTQAGAVVVDNQQESWNDGRLIFRPVVRFRTSDGREIITALENAPSRRSHIPGRPVTVVYDPQHPERAQGTGTRSGGGGVMVIGGVVFLGFAVLAYLLVSAMGDVGSGFFDPTFP